MFGEPQGEHRWLDRFLGTWTYEHECQPGPDQPAQKLKGRQTFTSLGGFWILGDGTGDMPGGGEAKMLLTIGYDPAKKHYVGSWIGSMMPNLWVYEGMSTPRAASSPCRPMARPSRAMAPSPPTRTSSRS